MHFYFRLILLVLTLFYNLKQNAECSIYVFVELIIAFIARTKQFSIQFFLSISSIKFSSEIVRNAIFMINFSCGYTQGHVEHVAMWTSNTTYIIASALVVNISHLLCFQSYVTFFFINNVCTSKTIMMYKKSGIGKSRKLKCSKWTKNKTIYIRQWHEKSNHCVKTLVKSWTKGEPRKKGKEKDMMKKMERIERNERKKNWSWFNEFLFPFSASRANLLTEHTKYAVSILYGGCDVFPRCSGAISGALADLLDRARKRTSESLTQRGTRVCIIKIYICTAIIIIARIILWGFCLKPLHTFTCRVY